MKSRRAPRLFVPLLCCAASAACAPTPSSTCLPVIFADLPVQFGPDRLPVIPARLNGAPAEMILDTGASTSVLTPQEARRLNISIASQNIRDLAPVNGYRGSVFATVTNPANLTLGSANAVAVFLVAKLSPGARDLTGLIGNDILRNYNLALNFPDHRLALYRKTGCGTDFWPWSGGHVNLPFTPAANGSPVLAITVDRTPLSALLDTGASNTVVNGSALPEAQTSPGIRDFAETTRGIGGLSGTDTVRSFALLTVGRDTSKNVWLFVSRSEAFNVLHFDAILGEDYLQSHRVFIDNGQNVLRLAIKPPA